MRQKFWCSVTVGLGLLLAACGSDDLPAEENPPDNTPVIDMSHLEGLPGIVPAWDPSGDSFYRVPWPTDVRLTDAGFVDLSDFPNSNGGVISLYRETIEESVQGFSVVPVTYIAFGQEVPAGAIPEPLDTLNVDSHIQLIALGEQCGERIPVETRFYAEAERYRDANVVAIKPVDGFVLRPASTYATVVLRTFGDESNVQTIRPAAFATALSDEGTGAYHDSLQPLRDCMASAPVLDPDSIAMATVFTTQDPVAEVRRIRDFVADPARTEAPTISGWRDYADYTVEDDYVTFAGTYETPIFQVGESPYNSDGRFGFDANGEPEIQRWEEVPVTVTVPDDGSEGPYPILIMVDGTFASQFGHVRDDFIQESVDAGMVVVSFLPQFHGSRATEGSDEQQHGFNYVNPESGRTVFRQQVIDTSYLIRVIREALPGRPGLPALDTSRIVYAGHSQGSVVGGMVAGVEPEIDAYAFNGYGGYLTISILERKDPFDIATLVAQIMNINGPLDIFHPVLQLAQMGADVVDSQSYAHAWTGWDANPEGAHILITNGMLDDTTHFTQMNAIIIAGDVAPIAPAPWDVDEFNVWDRPDEALPIEANRTAMDGSPLTYATYMLAEQGHFSIYRDDRAREIFTEFIRTAAEGVPRLSP